MSVICDAVLVVGTLDTSPELTEYLTTVAIPGDPREQHFGELDPDKAGGTKFLTVDVFAACFNHVLAEDVEAWVRAAPWQRRYPGSHSVLYLDHEFDDEAPKVIPL